MKKINKALDDLFKTLAKDKNITRLEITATNSTGSDSIAFTKEEIKKIAGGK